MLTPKTVAIQLDPRHHVDIEMQLTALNPPESIMRLIDEYTNLVLPQITQEEKADNIPDTFNEAGLSLIKNF